MARKFFKNDLYTFPLNLMSDEIYQMLLFTEKFPCLNAFKNLF